MTIDGYPPLELMPERSRFFGQRATRTERCEWDGLEIVAGPTTEEIAEAVRLHQETPEHRRARARVEGCA